MKIGTLTFHTAHNYGAVLQAYALVRTIQELGYDAEIIDYHAEFNAKRFATKPLKHYLSARQIYSILFRNAYHIPCTEVFTEFYKKYLPTSKQIYSKEDLQKSENIYDRIVTGSDQIWNLACTAGDDAYFLPFVNNKHKKSAYAASFGVASIKEEDRQKISNYIASFETISVREKEGADIVKKLTGKDACHVIDPTLLLDMEQWIQLADYSRCPDRPYLLVYLMSEDISLLRFAKRYAKYHNLKVIYISQRLFKHMNLSYLRNVTPNQWLGLFSRADTVVTNSFHGSAFAVNFGKNVFIKYIPRSIANSRLKNIIEDYQLYTHLLDKSNIGLTNFPPIDRNRVTKKLSTSRERSYDFIREQILA